MTENTQIIDKWVRPWDKERTDDLYQKDERYFSVLIKGILAYLTKNIILNGNPINHFIFNTGSSMMYIEQNGYEFSWCETSGEDQMYMKMPRCVVELGDITVDTAELSSPFSRGFYERISSIDGKMKEFSAEIRRTPIELTIDCKYVLSTFNESIILIQELIDKLLFQKYFNIIYLGQKIQCSIEFPNSNKIEFNKIDMASAEVNQKTIDIQLKVCSSYPIVNDKTEIDAAKTVGKYQAGTILEKNNSLIDNENKIIE
jgi:hypothetical protein